MITINSIVVAGLILFLAFDYRSEFQADIGSVRRSLDAEAATTLLAVQHLRGHSLGHIQQFLDRICSKRDDSAISGHQIVVRTPDTTVQANSPGHGSDGLLAQIARLDRDAATPPLTSNEDGEFLIGTSSDGGTSVYVASSYEQIERHVRSQLLSRIYVLAGLGLLVTGVVNVLLSRLVTRPVQILADTVRRMNQTDQKDSFPAFGTAEFDYLANEVRSMSNLLAAAEKDRHFQLDKAKKIQRAIVKSGPIGVPGYEIGVRYQPAEAVGGDLVDYAQVDGGLVIVVADVCGHGIPAALVTSMLQVSFHNHFAAQRSFAELFVALNDMLAPIQPAVGFVTMFAAHLHPDGRVIYTSAGHEPPLLARGGRITTLDSMGLPLGIDPHAEWPTRTLHLDPDSRLAVFTDGLVEFPELIRSEAIECLTMVVRESADLETEALADAIMATRPGHAQDDVCLVVIDHIGKPRQNAKCNSPESVAEREYEHHD